MSHNTNLREQLDRFHYSVVSQSVEVGQLVLGLKVGQSVLSVAGPISPIAELYHDKNRNRIFSADYSYK
jgi:hypothetical protein